ncbi:MAG: S1 family serine peptidase [Solirubrobacteraceae bacterium]
MLFCAPAWAVYPGTSSVPITQAPYQVEVVKSGPADAWVGRWCGGSVRDNQHIVTAAHCVFDNELGASGQPVSPAAIKVVAGTNSLGINSGFRLSVQSVSLDNDYDPASFSHDVAILTLVDQLDTNGPSIQPIQPVTRPSWLAAMPGTTATVTGWGRIASGSDPRTLRTTDVPIVSDEDCGPKYQGFDAPVMTCAGNSTNDACFGDSGSALVVPSATNPAPGVVEMLGIVSFGPPNGCAVPGYPGVYTEVFDADISNYLGEEHPMSAPRTVSSPSVVGTVAVGSTVTCDPGTWEGSPSFSYQFIIPTASGDVARTAQGAQNSYTIQAADAGSALECNVKGRNAGGLAFADSAAVTVPVPEQQPPVQPPNGGGTSQVLQDTAAPVARITKTACTATRCTLSVSVTDTGFSAGIKTVQSSVRSTYRSRCKRKGSHKTVACTKHRTITPSVAALTSTRYKVVASKLPYGTQRFTIVAIDKAGHRQALPTTKTVTTKKPKKHR